MDRQARRLLQSAREEDESLASLVSSPLYLWLQQVSAAGRKQDVWPSLASGCPRQRSLSATAGQRSVRILAVPSCVWKTCKKKMVPKTLRVLRPDDKVFVVEHAFISGTSRDVTPRDRFVFQKKKSERSN